MTVCDLLNQQIHLVKPKFSFLGSKIIVDHDCSLKIKRHLLLERKAMTNLDILESRDHFIDKGPFRQTCSLSSSHELI